MSAIAWVVSLLLLVALLYMGRGFWAWVLPAAVLFAVAFAGGAKSTAFFVTAGLFVVLALVLGIRPLRRTLVSGWLLKVVRPLFPRIGETERIALEAGTVWFDGDLFSGNPDWKKLLAFEVQQLSAEERAFMDGPVEKLCAMIDEWDIAQRRDLPPRAWDFLKEKGFFGMIIPKEYGGLGFSAAAHSAVVTKVASRSATAAVTVMVPNSLGPAELVLHYGTDEQRDHYLPRLASGEEIPCFALTGPEAGSDASAMQSVGVVARGTYEGEDVLGIRLNWRKRYITLGPVATVIGLAFQLRDPDGLLGGEENLGITCALIPAHTAGIEIGDRHDPMGVPFQNGPNWGRDVFVPLSSIIGGRDGAGRGWRMLMESLAAGRSISLPSLAAATAQLTTRVVGAYATVREQFDTPIGRFEGIEEPLALIGGLNYVMNAARTLTAGAVDAGEQPAVLSAIAKAYLTESMRKVVIAGMDIRAGAAISRGPRNVLAHAYQAVPIGITVEGANILTRSMIIYGQGAIRSHPFAQAEIEAAGAGDVAGFDRAFFGHINHLVKNVVRAPMLALTGGQMAPVPAGVAAPSVRFFGQFTRMSTAFALISDVAMVTLGSGLKRREKISGRLADALAWMYLGSAALKRFEDEGGPICDAPFLAWGCTHALHEIQTALRGVLDNLPNRAAAWALRPLVFPLGARLRPPSDTLGSAVARGLLENRQTCVSLTRDIYVPPDDEPGLGRLDAALDGALAALAVEKKIRDAIRAGALDKAPGDILLEGALAAGIITSDERDQVLAADAVRDEVIQVDSFSPEEYSAIRG